VQFGDLLNGQALSETAHDARVPQSIGNHLRHTGALAPFDQRPLRRTLRVADGWQAGPKIEPVDGSTIPGPKIAELMKKARANADMKKQDIIS
jgi:hypothetical protein